MWESHEIIQFMIQRHACKESAASLHVEAALVFLLL